MDLIKSDLYRYKGNSDFKSFIKAFIDIPGFRFSYFLRKSSPDHKSIFRVIYLLFYRHYKFKYGFQIPPQTKIGPGFFLGHFGLVVINQNSSIGKNCNISHGVTIGQANRGRVKGTPTIGDNVWIGTGSVIVGNVRIGNNVLIAPNTYICKDVPDNSIARGNPAEITPNKGATAGYINNAI
jgi:serine O-acetyltransferase